MDLQLKILELFEYRLFPELFKMAGENYDINNSFLQKLIGLQEYIYQLDEKLESDWNLSEEDLYYEWQDIIFGLKDLVGEQADIDSYLHLIRQYQKRELSLRQPGQEEFNADFIQFYYTKSCDVKLIRRLIYERFSVLNNWIGLDDWYYFDLVTEINDDVHDLYEDLHTLNGNRLLYCIYLEGQKSGYDRFVQILQNIKTEIASKPLISTVIIDMNAIIEKNILDTLHQLKKNISNFTDQDLDESKLVMNLKALKSVL